jgi:DNA polymerase
LELRKKLSILADAAKYDAFVGNRFNLQRYRGRAFRTPWAEVWLATYHPAAILRAPDAETRAALFAALVEDLKAAGAHLTSEHELPELSQSR